MKKITAGSRESVLAVAQSEIILELIRAAEPGMATELVTMKTTGDRILDRTLDKVGGKGLFIKELDTALLSGRVDISIHSLKDIPSELPEGIRIAAYSKREDPRDVLILPEGTDKLDMTLPIGCASQRRAAQITELFPGVRVKPVRGNVLTRLQKLDAGEYSALVLAKAGIVRLGLEKRISRVFSPKEILPAAGQGIIAVECRADCSYTFLDTIDDRESRICAEAERAFIRETNGGCSAPAAAFCRLDGDRINVIGMDVRGGKIIRAEITDSAENASGAGERLARMIISKE